MFRCGVWRQRVFLSNHLPCAPLDLGSGSLMTVHSVADANLRIPNVSHTRANFILRPTIESMIALSGTDDPRHDGMSFWARAL